MGLFAKGLLCAVAVLSVETVMAGSGFSLDPAVDRTCEIVVPDQPIPAEETAARLLVRHLPKMLKGIEIRVVREGDPAQDGAKRILVGSTAALQRAGFDVSSWGIEDELVAAREGVLYIAGGRPRGARYAVADFLERFGVTVTADDTEIDPPLDVLSWEEKDDLRRRPFFPVRYTATPAIRQIILNEFNKYNAYRHGTAEWGGYAAYGRYGDCHTFCRYSQEFPTDDPEVFALVKGVRKVPHKPGLSAPLCPSSPKTLVLFLKALERDVAASFEREKRDGRPRPLLYEISMDDNLTVCECATCRRIAEEEGAFAGVMLTLVNPLARRLAQLDPEAKMTMLAYQNTALCPRRIRPEPNVLPRICVQDREWMMNVDAEVGFPVAHPGNARFLDNLSRWRAGGRRYGVWEYWEYYTKGMFPYLFPRTYAEDLRYYADTGAENILIECEQVRMSFYQFKVWYALKLMDDPRADERKLISRFFQAHYGKAATPMLSYFVRLSKACEREMAAAPMGTRAFADYAYLDEDFYRESYGCLAKAEDAVQDDARSLVHVRAEYLALDRSLLRPDKRNVVARLGLSRKALIGRLRACEPAYLENLYGVNSDAARRELASTANFLAGETIEAPLPPEVKGAVVFDFKYNSFPAYRDWTFLRDDPDALGGKATEISGGKNFKGVFHKLPFTMGIYNALRPKGEEVGAEKMLAEVPQDEKFHLYYLGQAPLVKGSKIWLHPTWYFQLVPTDAFSVTPDYPSDVWVSLKFTGPAYVRGSSKPDGVFVDRIINAR